MHRFLFSIFILITFCLHAQDRKESFDTYPFQVVYAENAKLSNGLAILGRYDYLKKDAQIQLDSGFLILMHHSERLFEFSGDTLISMIELLNGMPEYLLKNVEERPDIYLFSKYRKPSFFYAFTECDSYPYFFHGYSRCQYRNTVDPNRDFSLTWSTFKELSPNGYILQIKDIFDRILVEVETKDPCVVLDLSELKPDKVLLIVEVFCNNLEEVGTGPVAMEFKKSSKYIPDFCSIETPIEFLQAWFFLTNRSDQNAKSYLNQLNQKSNHPFYQKLAKTWRKQ